MNVAYNMDCMEGMKQYPDKYFDLAVVDPPYGDACSQDVQVERERERWNRFGGRFDKYKSITCTAVAEQEREKEKRSQQGELARKAQVQPRCAGRGGTWATKYAKKLFRGM